jgi:hypothetical protein
VEAVRKHAGPHNSADIEKVRGELGHLSRAQQDAAINEARRRGHVSASAEEGGRGKISPKRQEALLHEGGSRLGTLSLRNP